MTPRRTPPLLILLGLAAAPAAAYDVVPANAVDTSEWECEYCPFDEGYRGDVTTGLSHVSDDAARFGDQTGYDQQGAYLNLDGQGSYAGDGYRATWTIEDLGLDSRAIAVDALLPAGIDIDASYRELPRNVFDTTSTVFETIGNGRLVLPASWQPAGIAALNDSLRDVDIRSERQTLQLGGRYRLVPRLRLSADYRRRERDGNDILAGSFFTQGSLLPRNIDQQTDEVDLGLTWAGDRGHVAVGWYGSWFRNKIWATTWDNPFGGPAIGRVSEAPDNSASQVSARGQYRFDSHDTVVNASAAFGRMKQNDALLSYSVNPVAGSSTLPRRRLDAKVDTSALAFSVALRPHERARLRMAWRYDERDNGTPRETWERVIVDSFASGDPQVNNPYGFERMRINFDGDLELPRDLELSAGYERTDMDRDFQEVAEQTEEGGWGRLRWRPGSNIDLSLKAGNAKRDINRYDTGAGVVVAFDQNPLLRKYNLAYRYREYADLMATASLPVAPVSVTLSAHYADDDYSKSTLGLTCGREMLLGADIDWAINERTSLVVSTGWHNIEAAQAGSEAFAAPDWTATNDDDFFNAGFGLRITGIADRTDLDFDYTHTDGSSDIELVNGAGRSIFPALESTRDSFRLRLRYRRSERLQGVLQLRYESFDSEDWALQGVQPGTIPNVLSLGADPYEYDVFVIGLGVSYALGST